MSTRLARSSIFALSVVCGLAFAEKGAVLQQLRFAPDGQHVLAQDGSGVTVLMVSPLAVAFRIPLERAILAQFTPDGRQIVLVQSVPRVDSKQIELAASGGHFERWSIADRVRVDSRELPGGVCRTRALSPDGRVYVCVDPMGTLRLIDISTAEVFFEKKRFGEIPLKAEGDPFSPVSFRDPGVAIVRFSSDGRFLVACPDGDAVGSTVAWDLIERRRVRLSGALKGLRSPDVFAFLGSDRILISPPQWKTGMRDVVKGNMVSFPGGKSLSRPMLPPPIALFPAADSRFVLVRPLLRMEISYSTSAGLRGFTSEELHDMIARLVGFLGVDSQDVLRAAACEISTGRVIISSTSALDAFGDQYVAESAKGEVGLYKIGAGLQATVRLGRN